ncbi:GNAT family N-acetyltransferase [candidate division KSB1 bacterium]|nr:GNAT family N-acetyltransferase [candidate division KSB1 bacterium]
MEYFRDHFRITTDKSRMDIDAIHRMLLGTYWGGNLPRNILEASMRSSLCWGLFEGDRQIGFARVISDYTTFAYLCDVVIDESYRKRGLGAWLLQCILEHPQLQGLRRWMLSTLDAHELYKKLGFRPLTKPEKFMEIYHPEVWDLKSEPSR